MFYISKIKVTVKVSLCESTWLWDQRLGFEARQK